MKLIRALVIGLAFLGAGAGAALAQQDKEKEALKRDLLKEVEKRLKAEEERLLKDIEKVIEEELNKNGKATPPAEPRKAPPAAPKKARGYLGIRAADLTDEEKKDLNIKGGIKIVEAVKDGPAAKAGLQPDDVVTQIDGRAIDSPQEVPLIVSAAGPGKVLKIDYLREGAKKTAQVTLGRHPADVEPVEPPKEQGKAPAPAQDDLRERVKKFLEKKEEPKAEAPQDAPKPKAKGPPALPGEGDDFFALDEEMFEQFRTMFEQFGIDPEQFFEKGKDGKYRLNEGLREMFKNFGPDKFKGLFPREEDPAPAPAPRKVEPPRKPAPKPTGKPWLGLQPEELSDELRAQLDLEEGMGLLVTEVIPGGPADKAGLKKNDILTKIEGKPLKGEAALAQFMETAKIGQEATLTVLRKSKEQTLKVTLGERKE